MKGSLQGDFSRFLLDRKKHYSSVLMQQGKVLLDADWNEQVALADLRNRIALRDLVGVSGAPAEAPGFEMRVETALRFDGEDDCLAIGGPDVTTFRSGEGFTLEMWVRVERLQEMGTLLTKFFRPQGHEKFREEHVVGVEKGRLVFRHNFPRVVVRQSQGEIAVSGRFYHVIVTYDRVRIGIFVDGERVCEEVHWPGDAGSLDETFREGETAFLVGAQLMGREPHHCFCGQLRRVCMWNRPMTASEVVSRRREPLSWPPQKAAKEDTGLLGDWRFDVKGGETVEDLSPHGHTAVLGRGRSSSRPAWVPGDLWIGPGRYYVDGVLCQLDAGVRYRDQHDYPQAPLPAGWPGGVFLAYLDVWERYVSARQDASIEEVALAGVDTTGRSQVLAQVKLLPVSTDPENIDRHHLPREWFELLRTQELPGLMTAARRLPAGATLGNFLYRVQIHNGGWAFGQPRPAAADAAAVEVTRSSDSKEDSSSGTRLEVRGPSPVGRPWQQDDCVEIYVRAGDDEAQQLREVILDRPQDKSKGATQPEGKLACILEADTAAGEIVVDLAADAFPAGKSWWMRPVATFKWSRLNGSVVVPISPVMGSTEGSEGWKIQLRDLGWGDIGLSEDGWVEIADDAYELRGEARHLCQMDEVDPDENEVLLRNPPPSGVGRAGRPFLRPWDQRGRNLVGGAIPVPVGDGAAEAEGLGKGSGWVDLEKDIQVRFSGPGYYRSGDFWWIPARTLPNNIEWAGGAQPPSGIEHRFAPLALVILDQGQPQVKDLRWTFQSRVTGAVSKAGDEMHGPLTVHSRIEVSESVEAGIFYGALGSPEAVQTDNLRDQSVTQAKLSPEVGTVPPGSVILGESPQPPPGYAYTGSTLVLPNPQVRWELVTRIPRSLQGGLRGVSVGDKLYFFPDPGPALWKSETKPAESGEVWEVDVLHGRWEVGPSMPEERAGFGVGVAEGRIYVVGGRDDTGKITGTLQEYDPVSHTWAYRRDMPTPRSSLAVAGGDGRLYAVGGMRRGWLGDVVTGCNEEYDPQRDAWTRRRSMPTPRYAFGAAVSAGRLFACGGAKRFLFHRWIHAMTNITEEYKPAQDRWSRRVAPMEGPRMNMGMAVVSSRLYAVGGEGLFGWSAEVEEYDPEGDRWTRGPALDAPLSTPGTAAIGGRLYAVGGRRVADAPSVRVEICPVAALYFLHRRVWEPERLEPETGSRLGEWLDS